MEQNMITSIFRAMKYDSIRGRQFFPHILQLESLKTDAELQALYYREITDVPDWMFIGWIPQILAHFDFDRSSLVDDLVVRLSESYPDALRYPFKLSLDQYTEMNDWRDGGDMIIDRSVLNRLKNNLKNSTVDAFIENIALLCLPAVKFRFHVQKLFLAIKNDGHRLTRTKWTKQVNKINELVFNVGRNLQSKYYTDLWHHQKEFLKLRDINPETLDGYNEIVNKMIPFVRKLDSYVKNANEEKISVKQLSAWMAEFKSFNSDQPGLELPGQYGTCGDGQPMPQSHVRITKFGKFVSIFPSLRRPMKIVCYGDDGRPYNFLVKYGEDLRLDERIEKLFDLMNTQMRNDKNCVRNNLTIGGFNVIPIGLTCGLLSWVENTMTLSKFLCGSREDNIQKQILDAQTKYLEYISQHTHYSEKKTNKIYWNAVENYSRMRVRKMNCTFAYVILFNLFNFFWTFKIHGI